MNDPTAPSRSVEVASVRKALEILCSFSRETPSLTVSELSRRLAIPKSTAHNLLRTLQSLDFLAQDPVEKRFRLGPRVFELGLVFSHITQLVAMAYPRLRRLAEQTRETVKLATLSGGEVLILAAMESPFQLHTRGDVGKRAPLHCTSLGKAMLASLPDSEIREIVAHQRLAPFTARTITSLASLEEEIRRIRMAGHSVDWEENEEGVSCVAAFIPDPQGRLVAAISVSGPVSRIKEESLAGIGAQVAEAARSIAESLGSSPIQPANPEDSRQR